MSGRISALSNLSGSAINGVKEDVASKKTEVKKSAKIAEKEEIYKNLWNSISEAQAMDDVSLMLQHKVAELSEIKDLNAELSQQLTLERQKTDMANAKALEARNKLDLVNNQLQLLGSTISSLQNKLQEERQSLTKCREDLESERARSSAAHNATILSRNEASEAISEKRKLIVKMEQLELQIRNLERNKAETEIRFRGASETLASHHDEEIIMLKKYVEDGTRRNNELEAQKKEITESYWRLNDRLRNTEAALNEVSKVHEGYKIQTMESEEALFKLKSEFSDLEDKHKKCLRELDAIEDQSNTNKSDNNKLKEYLKNIERELNEIKPEYEESKRINNSLASQLSNIQNHNQSEIEALQNAISVMSSKMETLEESNNSEKEELNNQLHTSQGIISNFEHQLSLTIEKLDYKTQEVEKLKNDLNSLKQVTNDVGSKLSRFEVKKVNLENQLEISKSEILRLQTLEQNLRKQNDKNLVQLQEFEMQTQNSIPKALVTTQIQNAIELAKKEWSHANSGSKREFDQLHTELDKIKNDYAIITSNYEKDKKKMISMKENVQSAENSKEAMEKKLMTLVESHSAAVARLEAQKGEAMLQQTTLKEELEEFKKMYKQSKNSWETNNVDIVSYKKETAELKEFVEKYKYEKERLKEIHTLELEHSRENNTRLMRENDELKHNIRDAMKTAAEQVAQFELQNRKLKEALGEAQKESANIMIEVQRRKHASTDLVGEVERLQNEKDNFSNQIKQLNNELMKLKDVNSAVTNEKLKITHALKERQMEIEKIKRDVKMLNAQIDDFQNKTLSLEKHKRKSAEALQNEKDESESMRLVISTLKDKVSQYENQIGELSSQRISIESHLRDRHKHTAEEVDRLRAQLKKAMTKTNVAENTVMETSSKLAALNEAANSTISELMKRLKISEETRAKDVNELHEQVKVLEERVSMVSNTSKMVGAYGIAKGKTVGEIADMLTIALQRSAVLEEENNELKEAAIQQEKELRDAESALNKSVEKIKENLLGIKSNKVEIKSNNNKTEQIDPKESNTPSSSNDSNMNIKSEEERQWMEIASKLPQSAPDFDTMTEIVSSSTTKTSLNEINSSQDQNVSIKMESGEMKNSQDQENSEGGIKMKSTITKVDAYLGRAKMREASYEDRAARMSKMGITLENVISSPHKEETSPSNQNIGNIVASPIKNNNRKGSRFLSESESPYNSLYANKTKADNKGGFLPNI